MFFLASDVCCITSVSVVRDQLVRVSTLAVPVWCSSATCLKVIEPDHCHNLHGCKGFLVCKTLLHHPLCIIDHIGKHIFFTMSSYCTPAFVQHSATSCIHSIIMLCFEATVKRVGQTAPTPNLPVNFAPMVVYLLDCCNSSNEQIVLSVFSLDQCNCMCLCLFGCARILFHC